MKRWTIYCHEHVESGRRYIGLTSQTMERRWKNHICAAKSSKGRWHFPNAIRKYGSDAFEHQILAQSWDLEGANETERTIIEQEGTRDPKIGFNILRGGLHLPKLPKKNPWDNPEYRNRMTKHLISIAQKGKTLSLEHRAKISKNNGMRNPEISNKVRLTNIGRSKSTETIEKLRTTSAGRVKSPEELAKMSAAMLGRKHSREHLDKIAAKRKLSDAQRIAARTHFDCKLHGPILLAKCYSKTIRNGIRYECRLCRKALKERWKARLNGN